MGPHLLWAFPEGIESRAKVPGAGSFHVKSCALDVEVEMSG